jgi:predicted ATPase/signal transduction histidine kinase
MSEHSGYRFEILRPGAELTLYRGHRSGGPPVLAVGISAPEVTAQAVERLAHEYALGPDLDPAWAAEPLSLTRHEGRPLLLLKAGESEPLDCLLARAEGRRLDLARFLPLAGDLARALGQMHAHGVVHKDIKPANVFVDDAGHVRFTGFGIASRLRRERQLLAPPEVIAGTFAYMAPEQTGRMNRSVDARSDLYSLGITLYELLTGALPFNAGEPMEWIHCHIARQPSPPSERAPAVPAAIDAIVLKLLAKNPEDRYQTAAGLEVDLRRCLTQWNAHGRLAPFTLADHDVPARLVVPEKLYGRDGEIAVLVDAFDRVVTGGATELVLVSGYAGIGKSSIVNELHKVLVPSRGLFAAGKFDQYKRDIPYATLAQAFQGLIRQLLSKPDGELAAWRADLMAALGPNAQLMVSLLPELGLVIGEQPPIPVVEPQEATARFQRVFRNLVGVFARPEHPLVLFIDDLQWLDPGTLELLAHLVTEPGDLRLLLIGAFRDNEVGPAHPLSRTLTAIRDAGGAISEVTLAPLAIGDITQLCADALYTDAERAASLAQLIADKTGGNPFFAIQFIAALADERLVAFDPGRSEWQWDIDLIRAKGITDNVADLMAAKLGRLPPATRAALGQLACLGNAADIGTVARLRGSSEEAVALVLRDAVAAGLVVPVDRSFAFIHDRVHEAAYALTPAAERAAVHLEIARVLVSLTPSGERDDTIFEIVNQFARGVSAIDSPAERELVAELHLAAGKRAKASSAYASALAYFAAGGVLLGDDSWERRYQLTLELQLNLVECEIVRGELGVAEARLAALSQRAIGLTDQSQVVCLSVLLYFTTGRSERAVEVGLGFLAGAGIEWPTRPSEAQVRAEYLEMRRRLAERPLDALGHRPPMSDPGCVAIMTVLTELFPAAYAVDRYLLELVLLRMTNLSLEYGHGESSSVAYSALNMVLGSHFGDYTTAYSLGRLACELVNRRGNDRFKARVYSCFAAFTMPWFEHLPLCQPLMTEAFEIGSSKGDMAFASYNSRNLMTHLLMAGMPLVQVQREAEQAMAFARKLQLGLPAERFIEQLELVRKLRGVAVDTGPADDEWATGDVDAHPQLAMMVCYHWVFRLEERFMAGDLPAALDAAARVDGIRWAMRSSIEEAEYDFYAALATAAACDGAAAKERERHLGALAAHFERIRLSAEHCPENFANRKALIAAELARLEGRDLEAEHLYEDAVRLARDHGFVQNQALASELAGRFHAGRGLDTIAGAYLRNARDCYERWGALGKVGQLDARYPQLRTRAVAGSPTTIDKPLAELDVETVDKASQTLSSEMALPSLLEKLLRLAVEHAGAERGLLILLHGDEPHIEAAATTHHGDVQVTLRRIRVTPSDLPQSALHYVLRTHERLILDDASAEGLDRDDEYVRHTQPKSVLCLPIFKQARVIGALYLENNLTTCAFTSGRVAVLDFLASQAAIWLDNARLYSDLQRSEAWLKEAQHLSSTGSFYWRADLDVVEFSEQMFRIYELDPGGPVSMARIASRIHPDDLPIMQEMIDVARGPGKDLDYLYRARMPDLSVKYLHMVAHGVRNKDGRLEYIGAIQDVTQRRLSEEALGKVQSELAHVARVTSLGVLTASIAHEVNQPLAGIVTNASTCLRMLGADPPNLDGARETTRRMIRDGHRAADVITRLRALFVRKGAATEAVDLNEATREVIALSGSELRQSGVQLRTELAAGLPAVTGDRVQLQQVILNLLLNAADAVRSVDDRPRLVWVRTAREDGDRVRLVVQDAGIGIDAKAIPRLFEAFYSTKAGGMGIGLSVSRSIIESHHGRLWAAANEGSAGASFAFSLPCSPESPRPVTGGA